MRNFTASQKALLGALIGLARALDGSGQSFYTSELYTVMADALRLVSAADGVSQARQLERVRQEKHRIAPDCSTCMNPCGRTADYDVDALNELSPELRDLKLELLDAAAAYAARTAVPEDDYQGALSLLQEAVFCIGYDWLSIETLQNEIEKLNA